MVKTLRKQIYDEVVDSFEKTYSFLGKQFAEEMLLTFASYNIQSFSNAPFRLRRHLMLCWGHSWIKTSLLTKAYEILGRNLCTYMSDISNAALRGTVDSGQFSVPYTLERPFAVCTEFGQLVSGGKDTELVQKLLNVLEEGMVEVSLGKIAFLSDSEREKAVHDWGVYFSSRNKFSYKTNWILMAATYDKKFLIDNALLSRFNVLYPKQPLDNKLTKHIMNSGGFKLNEEVKQKLREELIKDKPIETQIKLPQEIYELGETITPRDCSSLASYILCRSWWNVGTSKDEIIQMAKEIVDSRDNVLKTADDKVFEAIEAEDKTAQDIAKETGYTSRQVYYSLKNIRAMPTLKYDEEGNPKRVWGMR